MTEERRPSALELLRIREYRNFIIARFFYVMALRMVTTIIGWRIYEITHNPLAIGLIGLSEFLPAFCLALYAGHVIDKSDKRALLLRTTVFYLICVAGLLALAFGPFARLLGNHWIQWLTYIVIFCTGVIRAFAGPALNAIIAQIVPKEKLPGAVTLNTSAFLFASVTGHATAGFLIANTTYLFSFSVVAAYVIIAWICLFTLAPKQIMVTEEIRIPGKASRKGCALSSIPKKCWARSPSTSLPSFSAAPSPSSLYMHGISCVSAPLVSAGSTRQTTSAPSA